MTALRQRQALRDIRVEFERMARKKYKLNSLDLERTPDGQQYRKPNINHLWLGFKLYHENADVRETLFGKGTFVISAINETGGFDFRQNPYVHNHFDKAVIEQERLHQMADKSFALWRCVRVLRGNKRKNQDSASILPEGFVIPEGHRLYTQRELYYEVIEPSNFQEGYEAWVNEGEGKAIVGIAFERAMREWCLDHDLPITRPAESVSQSRAAQVTEIVNQVPDVLDLIAKLDRDPGNAENAVKRIYGGEIKHIVDLRLGHTEVNDVTMPDGFVIPDNSFPLVMSELFNRIYNAINPNAEAHFVEWYNQTGRRIQRGPKFTVAVRLWCLQNNIAITASPSF